MCCYRLRAGRDASLDALGAVDVVRVAVVGIDLILEGRIHLRRRQPSSRRHGWVGSRDCCRIKRMSLRRAVGSLAIGALGLEGLIISKHCVHLGAGR